MVALLMESKPDSDMLRAGSTQVRFVPVFAGRLLEVLAPVRLETSETGVALRMLPSASARAPDVILARAFLTAPVTEQTVITATEKTRKHCSFLQLPMRIQFFSNEVYCLPLTCIGRAVFHLPF